MKLKALEMELSWGEDIPLSNLRLWIKSRLSQYGEPLRWAITGVSSTNPENLSRQIIVEAVVIANE